MRLTLFLTLATCSLCAEVNLDQLMTPDEKKSTGVSTLTPAQKSALGGWIDQRFTMKSVKEGLSISLNINGGKRLLLSDHTLYEVAPSDVATASAWLSPSLIQIVPSGDPNYPDKLINTDTGVGVKAKKVTATPPSTQK